MAETTALDAYKVPPAVQRANISEPEWLTMRNLFQGAKAESVLLVWYYCKARHLDPFKKPVHIVPMRVKENNEWKTRDQVLPGIYEHRITAHRTGEYRGHDDAQYGPVSKIAGVEAPEWCRFIVYRGNRGQARETWDCFPVTVWFSEAVTWKDNHANDRWTEAPRQMLTKCAEAAALRSAFPEELGGLMTVDEMEGRSIDNTGGDVEPSRPAQPPLPKPDPEKYDRWSQDLVAATDNGLPAFEAAWAAAPRDFRDYLVATEPESLDHLRQKAEAKDGEVRDTEHAEG